MRIRLKPYVRFRMERFGGLVSNTDGRILFVTAEVIRALETRSSSPELYQFLLHHRIVQQEAICPPALIGDHPEFLLDEIEIPSGMECLSSPLALHLLVTRRCNLFCPHCATGGGEVAHHELTEAELHGLLDEALEMGVFAISLSGGEPLTRSDLLPFLARADAAGLRVTVLTNGLLLDETILGHMPRNVSFLVSLDGLGEGYEYFRGSDNYRIISRTIRLLQESGRQFALTCMFTRLNKDQTRKVMQRFLLAEGIPVIPTPVLPLGRARSHEELLLSKDDAEAFVALKQMKREYYATKKARSDSPSGQPSFTIDDMTEIFESAFWACSGTRSDLAVNFDGTVYPCLNCVCASVFPLGNIRETTVKQIWHSSEATKRFRQITWSDFRRCSGCDIASFCNFRCPALSLIAHGDPLVCGADAFTQAVIRLGARQRLSDPLR
ncbi:MAG: radical SAM protein [Bacillota bacterium]